MKVEELRLTNLINTEFGISEIAYILDNGVLGLKCGNETVIEEVSPIPLNEEWLKRCGLKFSYYSEGLNCYNYWNKENDFSVDFDGDLFHYRLYETKRRKHIMYVHQLQNLYFALTGHELEIK